jgi:hypothetical protein
VIDAYDVPTPVYSPPADSYGPPPADSYGAPPADSYGAPNGGGRYVPPPPLTSYEPITHDNSYNNLEHVVTYNIRQEVKQDYALIGLLKIIIF